MPSIHVDFVCHMTTKTQISLRSIKIDRRLIRNQNAITERRQILKHKYPHIAYGERKKM